MFLDLTDPLDTEWKETRNNGNISKEILRYIPNYGQFLKRVIASSMFSTTVEISGLLNELAYHFSLSPLSKR